jgi:hypothetical protein
MDTFGSEHVATFAEARLPRWNVWFIAAVMVVFTAIFAALATAFWVSSPHESSHVLGAAMCAIPVVAAWYLDRVCPRRVSAAPSGLRWQSFILGRERQATWDAIAEILTVFTSANDGHGDVWLRLRGRGGRIVLPGQMIGRDDLVDVVRRNARAAVS